MLARLVPSCIMFLLCCGLLSAGREDGLCGPRNLVLTAARLGIPLELKTVATECNVTELGVSMLDLKRAAEHFGFQAHAVRLAWQDLKDVDAPVILFVDNQHFCLVDPREKAQSSHLQKIRFYDPPEVATWISQAELERTWQGEALIVKRSAGSQRFSGPRILFDTLLTDYGSVSSEAKTQHEFSFKNIGTEPLEIKRVKGSCGCTEARATNSLIEPGGDGSIYVGVDLNGRQGKQAHQIIVETNDPLESIINLTFQGNVVNPVHVSTGLIDFGQVYPGQTIQREFTLTDRGDGDLRLHDSTIAFAHTGNTTNAPQITVRWGKKSATSRPRIERTSFQRSTNTQKRPSSIHPQYQVFVDAKVDETSAPMSYTGALHIDTNQHYKPKVTIPFRMEIVDDLYVTPPKVIFGLLEPGKTASRTVTLSTRSGHSIDIIRAKPNYNGISSGNMLPLTPYIQISEPTGSTTQAELTLLLPGGLTYTDNKLLKGDILFETANGNKCTLTWLCKPQL